MGLEEPSSEDDEEEPEEGGMLADLDASGDDSDASPEGARVPRQCITQGFVWQGSQTCSRNLLPFFWPQGRCVSEIDYLLCLQCIMCESVSRVIPACSTIRIQTSNHRALKEGAVMRGANIRKIVPQSKGHLCGAPRSGG